MCDPKLLLLDEPSLGLSPILTDEVLSQIPIIAKTGMAIVLAEQNLSKALEVTDRAYVFQTGRVVLEGAAETLRSESVDTRKIPRRPIARRINGQFVECWIKATARRSRASAGLELSNY